MKTKLGIFILLLSQISIGADSLNALEQKLATKRESVETLFQEIEDKKGQFKVERSQLQARRNEIEAEIQRIELEMAKVQKGLDEINRSANSENEKNDLVLTLNNTLNELEEQIAIGIPYKNKDRLAFVHTTRSQLENKTETKEKIVKKLWNFLEDEYRLTKENILARELISVEGEEKIADVAKLGMIFSFFQTPDGRVGVLQKKSNGHYEYIYEIEGEKQKQIANIVDSLKKQIRVGEFMIPNRVMEEAL